MSKNVFDIGQELMSNAYPGRGIILGRTPDNKKNVIAYFIMGRSENSRNRVFTETKDGIRTEAFDPSKMVDPSLIIYHPVRLYDGTLVVTNGDQTDTIVDFLKQGKSYFEALRTRQFEPDAPNYTSRISGVVNPDGSYSLSILKNFTSTAPRTSAFSTSMTSQLPVWVTSSIPTSATAIRCRRSAASRSASASSCRSRNSPTCSGTASTSRTRSRSSSATSTSRPANMSRRSATRTQNNCVLMSRKDYL